MSVKITTRPVRVSISGGAARAVTVSSPTARAIELGRQGVRGPAGDAGPAGPPGADAAGQIPPIPFGWGDAAATVFTPTRDGMVTVVRIQFTEAFNDPEATVQVGVAGDPGALMPAAYNAPGTTREFENTPDLPLAEGQGVLLTIAPGTSSQGAGFLFLTFLPTE